MQRWQGILYQVSVNFIFKNDQCRHSHILSLHFHFYAFSNRCFSFSDKTRSTTWLHPRTGEPVNSGHMIRSGEENTWSFTKVFQNPISPPRSPCLIHLMFCAPKSLRLMVVHHYTAQMLLLPLTVNLCCPCSVRSSSYFFFVQIYLVDGKKGSAMMEPATSLSKKVSFFWRLKLLPHRLLLLHSYAIQGVCRMRRVGWNTDHVTLLWSKHFFWHNDTF